MYCDQGEGRVQAGSPTKNDRLNGNGRVCIDSAVHLQHFFSFSAFVFSCLIQVSKSVIYLTNRRMNSLGFRLLQSAIGEDCARQRVFNFAPKRECAYRFE